MTEYKIHPAADLFPMLDGDDLTMLQNDIMVEGQLDPIVTWNGYIIDGRNRLKACQNINRKPRFKERAFKNESEVISFIISTNIRRRHLTTSQRAMIASELAKLERGGEAGVHKDSNASIDALATAQPTAAQALNVSRASVQRARAVAKADPKLAEKVKAGELTLNAAHKKVQKPKTPPSSPIYIPPDPCEEPDLPPELPGDRGEPVLRQMVPSQRARDLLASAMSLSEFDRGWIASELSRSR